LSPRWEKIFRPMPPRSEISFSRSSKVGINKYALRCSNTRKSTWMPPPEFYTANLTKAHFGGIIESKPNSFPHLLPTHAFSFVEREFHIVVRRSNSVHFKKNSHSNFHSDFSHLSLHEVVFIYSDHVVSTHPLSFLSFSATFSSGS
jgi:hypothetical protein